MYFILISSLLLFLLPEAYGAEGKTGSYPSQYKEKARISWKAGASGGWDFQNHALSLHLPMIIGEGQVPLRAQFSWLLQAGGGLRIRAKTETFCNPRFIPEPPEPPFDSEFFLENYKRRHAKATNKSTCRKKHKINRKFTPYFAGRTGLRYDGSNVYAAGQGGIILSAGGAVGWTGELLIGKKMGLDISLGLRAVSFDNSMYYGLVFYFGKAIKSWWAEKPL